MNRSKQFTSTSHSRKRNRPVKEARVLLGLGLIVLLAVAAALLFQGGEETPTFSNNAELIRADSPTLGPADAKVTIVEFLDPECESCRAMYPVVKEVMEEYDGQVRLVVRYFPLHQNSFLAAAATEAAGEQGQYWEMQQILFERQPEWGEQSTPQTAIFVQYARVLGLNEAQFMAGLENPDYATKIERDRGDGISLGVQGTPTFFVNGRKVEQLGHDELFAAVEAALRENP